MSDEITTTDPQETQDPEPPVAPVDTNPVTEPADAPPAAEPEADRIDNAVAQATAQLNAEVSSLNASLQEKETELKETKARFDSGAQQIASLTQARDTAVSKYRASLAAANPAIPAELITGDTIEDIDASLETAKGLVDKIREGLTAENESVAIPAGAPTRNGTSTEGMSTREKINLGLSSQKRS